MHVPSALSRTYFAELDGLRGFAILAVLIGHISINTPVWKLGLGNIGVEIFFVLSGFLITTLLLKEKLKSGGVSLRKFYIRRALRILPVAYLFLTVLLLLNFIFKLKLSSLSFITAALFIKNFNLNYENEWLNGHFWTLAVEEQFYLIFPVVLIYSLKNYIRVAFAIVLLVPVFYYLTFNNIGLFYSNSVIHKASLLFINLFQRGTASILTGSLLSVCMFKKLIPAQMKYHRVFSLLLLVFGICFRMYSTDLIGNEYVSSIIFSLIIALVIFFVMTSPRDFLNISLRHPWLVKMGILSYSIYIWQQIFLYKQPWGNSFKYADSLLFNIPMLILAVHVSYYYFESRFLKLKTKFKQDYTQIDKY